MSCRRVNSITGWPATLWLTDQIRVDRDYAVFGELSYDLTPEPDRARVGYRFYRYDNSLDGFFGFGKNNSYGSNTGENSTVANRGVDLHDAGHPRRVPASICPTRSRRTAPPRSSTSPTDHGRRHGVLHVLQGLPSRRREPPPAAPAAAVARDLRTGLPHQLRDRLQDQLVRQPPALQWAFFWEDWKNFQYGFLGQNSFTIVRNAGSARIKGAEQQLEWSPVKGLNVSLAATELDPKSTRTSAGRRCRAARRCRCRSVSPPTRCPPVRSCRSCRSSRETRRYATPSRWPRTCDGHVQAVFAYQSQVSSRSVAVREFAHRQRAGLRHA